MGLSDLFIDPYDLPDGVYGFVQLLFLLVAYAYILCTGSNYISDGSELLLLIPSVAGLVGSVILPVLGAVPDGAIVLFSGMGPDAQEQLSVGVGALAGSTIMLLTLPWFLSVIAGRVSVQEDGNLRYRMQPKLLEGKEWAMSSAVDCSKDITKGGWLMMITSISYLVIQIPALQFEGDSDEEIGAGEKNYALAGLILCIVFFFGYLLYQYLLSKKDDEKMVQKQNQIVKKNLDKGVLGIVDVFRHDFEPFAQEMAQKYQDTYGESYSDRSNRILKEVQSTFSSFSRMNLVGKGKGGYSPANADENVEIIKDATLKRKFEDTVQKYFHKYDADNSGAIDIEEIRLVFKDLNERMNKDEMDTLFKTFDVNNDGSISFKEFSIGTAQYIVNKILMEKEGDDISGSTKNLQQTDQEIEEEHEEMPEEFEDLTPEQRTRAIVWKSCFMMFMGTAIVLLFSDPMVDVLTAVGDRTGVPSFYVAFVLAPLASNASELIASYNYAAKKTKSTMLVSLSALQGAACMNNTFCLAVFLALIYFKGLAWEFSAETLSIIAVQFVIAIFSAKDRQTLVDAFLVMSLYPISLALVAFLEAIGWD